MENSSMKDQVAVITGAASGLGLAISKKLASEGVKLALLDIADKIPTEFEHNSSVKYYKSDVTKEEDVKNIIQAIHTDFGRIDILVNSAGITGKTNTKSHLTETDNLSKVFGFI